MATLSAQGLLDLLTGWWTSNHPESDETRVVIPIPSSMEDVDPTPVPRTPMRCGAWAGWASMASDAAIRRDVALAKKVGLQRLDIIINDHSKARQARDYDTYSMSRIKALLKTAVDAGLDAHVTSWVMPHDPYIRRMGLELRELHEAVPYTSLVLDAEEPWTQAIKPMSYTSASDLVAEVLGPDLKWGVTGIGYASPTKLGPLVKRSSFMLPQCYATNTTSLRPAEVAPKLCARWRETFGDRELVVGLASYNQRGIAGHTIDSAIRASFQGAQSQRPSAITWWSLGAIRTSSEVQQAIKAVTSLVAVEHGVA
jgi:hypothetical protein